MTAKPSTSRPPIVNEFFDQELNDLIAAVATVFGEDMAVQTIDRVHQTFSRPRFPMTVVRIMQFQLALKAELQRLVRPH